MRQSVDWVRGILLLVGLVLMLAGCSRHPEVGNWVLLRPGGVTIEFGVDTCNADLQAEVVESATRVEVTITALNDTTDACRDLLVVTLAEPLGDRELTNGATGKALQVRSAED